VGGYNGITIKTGNQNIRKEDGRQNMWSHKRRRLENENQQGDKECIMRCGYRNICKTRSTKML
jgi:hypothetical protein